LTKRSVNVNMSPLSKEKIEEKRAASINKIFGASLELFSKQGFQSTSISQIARKAGISKGLIYNYFESKLELLEKLMESFGELEENMMSRVIDDDPRKFLENIFKAFFFPGITRTQ